MEITEGDEDRYRLSIALGRHALGPHRARPGTPPSEFSGVLYPSVAMGYMGDNVALRPKYADSALELKEVRFVRILAIDDPDETSSWHRVTYEPIDYCFGVRESGHLIWNKNGTASSVASRGPMELDRHFRIRSLLERT